MTIVDENFIPPVYMQVDGSNLVMFRNEVITEDLHDYIALLEEQLSDWKDAKEDSELISNNRLEELNDAETLAEQLKELQDELKVQKELADHGGNDYHKAEVERLTDLIINLE